MRKVIIYLVISLLVLVGILVLLEKFVLMSRIGAMTNTSSAFNNGQPIPDVYTCKGKNINPPLSFSDSPANAKSLVLIVDDPDAPMGTWTHWVVYNIPPDVKEIQENSQPKGTEGMTSFGKPGYGGPCPPSGTHRYFFKVYALDTMLLLQSNAERKAVEDAMKGHIIASGELMGLYSHK